MAEYTLEITTRQTIKAVNEEEAFNRGNRLIEMGSFDLKGCKLLEADLKVISNGSVNTNGKVLAFRRKTI